MVSWRIFHGLHQQVDHPGVKVSSIDELAVDEDSNLKRIMPQTDFEQIFELGLLDQVLGRPSKLGLVVFSAVHFENNVDVICGDQEALSKIHGGSLVQIKVDGYFFKIGLTVFSVGVAQELLRLLEGVLQAHF